MHLRQLKYIENVTKYGTMRETARQLFVTEPTISQQVREFEKEVGFPVFEKEGRRIRLTKEGEAILPAIRDILLAINDLEHQITEINDPFNGRIQIGIGPITASKYLPKLFKLFNQVYPKVKLNVVQGGVHELTKLLIETNLDVVVAPVNKTVKETIKLNELEYETLFCDEYVAIVSEDHPLASQNRISIYNLSNEKLILYRAGILREYLLSKFGPSLDENIIFSTENNESTRELVRLGIGISIIPKFFIDSWSAQEWEGISCVKFNDVEIKPNPCCIYSKKRYRPQYLNKFISILGEISREEKDKSATEIIKND